ncbi:MAG: hypothetical protein RLZZ298_3384 [Pseudomonadota bacterium]|jgi:hypothetical protein
MALYFEVFNPLNKWKKGEYTLAPQVSIRIATYRTESGGAVTVGPYLASEIEIDESINFLIKELEDVRKQAKRELKASLKKQLGKGKE